MTDMTRGSDAHKGKFILDENTRFKINARQVKLFGLWVAELMGLEGDAATQYAKTLVVRDMDMAGHDDVLEQVRTDLHFKGIDFSAHRIEHRLQDFLPEAERQIMEEG